MIRQDYLLRMIEQAARMLARLTRLQAEQQTDAAGQLSSELAAQFLGLEHEQLRNLDDRALLSHLQQHGPTQELGIRLGVAVELLRAEAASARAAGDSRADVQFRARALGLLLRARINALDVDVPAFVPGLEVLLGELEIEQLPLETAVLLACGFEHAGQFAEAEDTLFAVLDHWGGAPGLRELGEGFYQRLLSQSDDRLAAGNLPREEVEQGLRAWCERTGADDAATA